MTTATETTTTTPTLDDVLARIDALAVAKDAPADLELDQVQFASYVAHHMTKAETEEAEPAKIRLAALKAAVTLAKAAFETATVAKIKPFDDSFKIVVADPKTADVPTGTRSDGAALETNDSVVKSSGIATIRKLVSLSLALKDEAGEVRLGVAKAMRATVSKAGEAQAILDKLAGMFGIDMSDPDMKGYSLRWKISDAVSAIQQAAELESTIATLTSTLGVGAAPAAPAAPPASETEAAAKAAVAKGAAPVVDATAWPADMSATKYDARKGEHVAPSGWGNVGGR